MKKKEQHTELAMYYKLLDLTTRPHTASPRYCGQPCGFHVFCECPHACPCGFRETEEILGYRPLISPTNFPESVRGSHFSKQSK